MPSRVQNLVIGLGIHKQADITTQSTDFICFPKLNMDITNPTATTENNSAWIGKGTEYATSDGIFKVARDVKNRIEKYGSAEFVTWALAYTLGNVSQSGSGASGVYTITPIDPTQTLQLPYFTEVEQLDEAGSPSIDNAYLGCCIEDFSLTFNYGPGLQSVKCNVSFVGSGNVVSPSTDTVPEAHLEHNMLSQSMACTINGVDYVAATTLLNGTFTWKNNLLEREGYYPGAGLEDGFAIRGRLEIGNRIPTFEFTARLLAASTEYTKLIALTEGSAALTFTYDATHTVTLNFPEVVYETVTYGQEDGLVTVKVNVLLTQSQTGGSGPFNVPPVNAVCVCGIDNIAQ